MVVTVDAYHEVVTDLERRIGAVDANWSVTLSF